MSHDHNSVVRIDHRLGILTLSRATLSGFPHDSEGGSWPKINRLSLPVEIRDIGSQSWDWEACHRPRRTSRNLAHLTFQIPETDRPTDDDDGTPLRRAMQRPLSNILWGSPCLFL